eukprot:scaffold20252_cov135-Isochrysis_galbana.AAC.5
MIWHLLGRRREIPPGAQAPGAGQSSHGRGSDVKDWGSDARDELGVDVDKDSATLAAGGDETHLGHGLDLGGVVRGRWCGGHRDGLGLDPGGEGGA